LYDNCRTGSTIRLDGGNNGTSTGQNGETGGGVSGAVREIKDETERVRGTCASPQGLARVDGDDRRHVGTTVEMAVTDRRILFVARRGEGADAGSLAYGDLAAVDVEGDEILVFTATDGVRWEFPLLAADPDAVEPVLRDLRWVGEVRSRLVACRNDVELAVGRMRDHAAAMEWKDAERTYRSVRERLDGLVVAVQWTGPIPDGVLAPELTDIERTIERAFARLQVDRGQVALDRARRLLAEGAYDRAGAALADALECYERARGRAEATDRGDAFRFGEQRKLREALDRLGRDIEAVAADFRPEAREEVERCRAELARTLRRLAEPGSVAPADGTDRRDLADIDTHQEITLDTTVADSTADVRPDEGSGSDDRDRDGKTRSDRRTAIRPTDAPEE
jgi:hypothetical protein